MAFYLRLLLRQMLCNCLSRGLLLCQQLLYLRLRLGRMMMGMFARSVGDDELSSKIEINDQGHVIANGQRIQ